MIINALEGPADARFYGRGREHSRLAVSWRITRGRCQPVLRNGTASANATISAAAEARGVCNIDFGGGMICDLVDEGGAGVAGPPAAARSSSPFRCRNRPRARSAAMRSNARKITEELAWRPQGERSRAGLAGQPSRWLSRQTSPGGRRCGPWRRSGWALRDNRQP